MLHQSSEKILVTFKDVAACFSEEEWKQLHEREKLFYIEVMQKIHQALITLGYHILNPKRLLRVITWKGVCKVDQMTPKSRADLHDPTSCHDRVTDPTPDILLRIQYKEEQSCRDLQSSEETEIGTVPMTGPLMATPDFSLQIKEEGEPGSEERESLACDPGHHSIHMETLLRVNKFEDSVHVDEQDLKSQADLDKTISSHHPAMSPTSEVFLSIQQEQEQCGRDAASPEEGKMINSPGPGNGTLVKIESLQTNQRQINFQKEMWDLADEEHEESTELIKKLVHLQNNQIPCTSVECENHTTDHISNRPSKTTEYKKTFNDLSALKIHHRIHTGGKPYECTECEKHFTNLPTLKGHKRIHTRENPYECTECSKSFHFSSAFKLHQRHTHARGKPHECAETRKSFSVSSALIKHQRTHTGEKPYECTKCKKIFTRLSAVKKHHRIHSGEKPYVCSECGKSFSDSSNLKVHHRIHSGEKPYECTWCKKVFTQLIALKKHQRIHTGEKPYACSECQRSFSDSSNLKAHKRTHTGEKPYECRMCKKMFARLSDMKKHQRIHTGEKPYKC